MIKGHLQKEETSVTNKQKNMLDFIIYWGNFKENYNEMSLQFTSAID